MEQRYFVLTEDEAYVVLDALYFTYERSKNDSEYLKELKRIAKEISKHFRVLDHYCE